MSNVNEIPLSHRLENRLQHPSFAQPDVTSIKVWRYMDLSKFIWLLKERQLYLARLDNFPDPFEGSLTAKTIEGIDLFLRQKGSKSGFGELSSEYIKQKKATFACCWHANEQESEAMWRLYCGNSHGVAIQTTYQQLINSINDEGEIYIGCVKYINYENEWFPDANVFHPVMHKREAFSHEREVRLVSSLIGIEEHPPEQILLNWDCEQYIDSVYVDPYAPEYYYNVVEAVLDSMAPFLKGKLVWSQMRAAPVF